MLGWFAMNALTPQQQERYSRHIVLPEIGENGQRRISDAKVLVVGVGGLGSPAAFYLAASGVGTLGLMDNDTVDLSNLQRQILHGTADLGRLKIASAAEKLTALNPEINLRLYREDITSDNGIAVIGEYDFVVSATDNFDSKYRLNDACVAAGVPFSHGGIVRFHGQTITVAPNRSACFRCLFSEPPPPDLMPSATALGVLGPAAGLLGTIQATEAIKYVAGIGDLLNDVLLTFNVLTMEFQKIQISRRPGCSACGER
jgi:molybdopterin-synthase adenylyltransferase